MLLAFKNICITYFIIKLWIVLLIVCFVFVIFFLTSPLFRLWLFVVMKKRQFTSVSIGVASTLEPFTVPAVSEEGYCGYYGNFYRVEQINKHVILYLRHLFNQNPSYLHPINFPRISRSVVTFYSDWWKKLLFFRAKRSCLAKRRTMGGKMAWNDELYRILYLTAVRGNLHSYYAICDKTNYLFVNDIC